MGIVNFKKEINKSEISCGGSFFMKLSIAGEPDILTNPADIVLVLDTSGSMTGEGINNLKLGANEFIDILSKATSPGNPELIGSGSKIGLVTFSTKAMIRSELTDKVTPVKNLINTLSASGSTNHSDAFTLAKSVIDNGTNKRKIVILFTDGITTEGPDAAPFAKAIKDAGGTIYCLGLNNNGNLDKAKLDVWATNPPSSFVTIAPTSNDIQKLFDDLAINIIKPGGSDISIEEIIMPDFEIMSVASPTKGTIQFNQKDRFIWNIPELGTTASEGAEVEFTVIHKGTTGGNLSVNKAVNYSDNEGNTITAISPIILVNCGSGGNDVFPEKCPAGKDITLDSCETSVIVDTGETVIESLGRIIQVNTVLKNVCPGKRVAMAAILTEVDSQGVEEDRGMKIFAIAPHTGPACKDLNINCIKFVLPESLNSQGKPGSLCTKRNFKVKFIAHYIDSDFECCNDII